MAGGTGMNPPNDDPPPDQQPSCFDSYAACDCGDDSKGFEKCNADGVPACDCSAAVKQAALSLCMAPCAGDITGDWMLSDVCAPTYAKGNCDHPVYQQTGKPGDTGLAFGADGNASGSLDLDTTLLFNVSEACTRQAGGSTLSDSYCAGLAQKEADVFEHTATKSTCTLQDSACECEVDLSSRVPVRSPYVLNASAKTVQFAGITLQYCVQGDTLSMQEDATEASFIYTRSKVSLPFVATALGKVEDAPTPVLGLTVGGGDCTSSVITFDTDAMTVSCGASAVRAKKWGDAQTSVFFLHSLSVPTGKNLVFKGNAAGIIVAEKIDVQGTISFLKNGSSALGTASSTGNTAAGGGAHCSAGGSGAAWAPATPRAGAMPFGTFMDLAPGGNGGDTSYTYTNDLAPGGLGGGAIALFASVSINVAGTIDVSGAMGDATGLTPEYGAGGGAGGTILLESPAVTVTTSAKLLAVGGPGGGSRGGAGATAFGAGLGGTTAGAATLGGGGGGVGRIVINSASTTTINGSSLQPPEGNCSALGMLTALAP